MILKSKHKVLKSLSYKLKLIIIINIITSHTENVTPTNQDKGLLFFYY